MAVLDGSSTMNVIEGTPSTLSLMRIVSDGTRVMNSLPWMTRWNGRPVPGETMKPGKAYTPPDGLERGRGSHAARHGRCQRRRANTRLHAAGTRGDRGRRGRLAGLCGRLG